MTKQQYSKNFKKNGRVRNNSDNKNSSVHRNFLKNFYGTASLIIINNTQGKLIAFWGTYCANFLYWLQVNYLRTL